MNKWASIIGSIFNIWPAPSNPPKIEIGGFEDDQEALESDWKKLESDWKKVGECFPIRNRNETN